MDLLKENRHLVTDIDKAKRFQRVFPSRALSLKKGFQSVNAKYLVISISSDWLYPPKQSKEFVKTLMQLNKDVTYTCLESPYGHDAFLLENEELKTILKTYIKNIT